MIYVKPDEKHHSSCTLFISNKKSKLMFSEVLMNNLNLLNNCNFFISVLMLEMDPGKNFN